MTKRRSSINRRTLLRTAAAAVPTMLASPAILSSRAFAQDNVVRILGVETAALEDWSDFEKETGLKVEFEGMNSDPGIFRQQVVANEVGERIDIILMDGGIEDDLGEKGFFGTLDLAAIPGASDVPEGIMTSPLATGPSGKQFGMPVVMNADSFAYYPEEIGEEEPLSYALLFDSDTTKGRVSLENTWLTTLPMAALYTNHIGLTSVSDPANMTPDEARAVVDFLVERKKAGQFRTFWSTWEESIDLMSRKEVIVENCWEPAVLEMRKGGADVRYATTLEGYNKWMICAYIPTQVTERGATDKVNAALSGFLGGAYAAQIAQLRGYATANAEAGLDYAEQKGLSDEAVEAIKANIEKVNAKFAAPQFWQNAAPEYVQDIESEFERFRLA